MKKLLITAVLSLSALVFPQPGKADSNLPYSFVYKTIATSDSDTYKNQEFRVYVLKWLEQDMDYPYRIATSFCKYRRSGRSTYQFIEMIGNELKEKSVIGSWSEPRVEA